MNNISGNELVDLCTSDNLSLGALQETINILGPRVSSQNPSCFHKACMNKDVTLEIIQLLYNTLSGALRLRNNDGELPIHLLCDNEELDDTTSLDILRFMLEIDPTLPSEVDEYGYLPIHIAVQYKSTTFCNILIDAHPESLRIESDNGLPIHIACTYGAAICARTKSIELLLKYDPDAASKKVNNDLLLPLHLACGGYVTNIGSVRVLYDVYPEAIFARDRDGRTPFDFARKQPVIDFLQTQLVYARQAQDTTAMATLDEDGWLPLHHALKDDAPLGSIKLLIRGNRAALQVADQNGVHPVHIACKFSSVKVVKYLVELTGDTLNNVDADNNSPLHYACRRGNLGIVKYLLQANVPSVSERNNDNKLAIHLLFECGESILDRESMEYVEAVRQLILANPEMVRDFMSY